MKQPQALILPDIDLNSLDLSGFNDNNTIRLPDGEHTIVIARRSLSWRIWRENGAGLLDGWFMRFNSLFDYVNKRLHYALIDESALYKDGFQVSPRYFYDEGRLSREESVPGDDDLFSEKRYARIGDRDVVVAEDFRKRVPRNNRFPYSPPGPGEKDPENNYVPVGESEFKYTEDAKLIGRKDFKYLTDEEVMTIGNLPDFSKRDPAHRLSGGFMGSPRHSTFSRNKIQVLQEGYDPETGQVLYSGLFDSLGKPVGYDTWHAKGESDDEPVLSSESRVVGDNYSRVFSFHPSGWLSGIRRRFDGCGSIETEFFDTPTHRRKMVEVRFPAFDHNSRAPSSACDSDRKEFADDGKTILQHAIYRYFSDENRIVCDFDLETGKLTEKREYKQYYKLVKVNDKPVDPRRLLAELVANNAQFQEAMHMLSLYKVHD